MLAVGTSVETAVSVPPSIENKIVPADVLRIRTWWKLVSAAFEFVVL